MLEDEIFRKNVEVLFRDGERIRVKLPASSKFGWIDTAKTTDTEPGADEPAEPAEPVNPE